MRFLSEINSPADLRQLRVEDLQEVADEVRQFIIDTCSRVGGHTGASLGAVELAVAMHYVFDTPNDRLVCFMDLSNLLFLSICKFDAPETKRSRSAMPAKLAIMRSVVTHLFLHASLTAFPGSNLRVLCRRCECKC